VHEAARRTVALLQAAPGVVELVEAAVSAGVSRVPPRKIRRRPGGVLMLCAVWRCLTSEGGALGVAAIRRGRRMRVRGS
jgi:hypothetical protein